MDSLRNEMRRQMVEKGLFDQARGYAFAYADGVAERRVFPSAENLANLTTFDEPLPDHTGDAQAILRQLHENGSPNTVAQIGGRYFGFVNGGIIPMALAARWLTDFWDQNTALYVISPITSTLESVTERWLRDLFSLPDSTVAGFVSGSSMATFCGLAAGRYRLLRNLGWDINRQGLNGAPKIRIVTGAEAHATVLKAVALLGLGIDNIETVACDEQGRILADKVPELDDHTLVILQAGNVNSGSFDPFVPICQKARQAGAWVHIDGAFGLWAGAVERLKHLTNGIELAHSWSVDGHKTLNTPYDSGIVLCADPEALVSALQATSAYIHYSEHKDGMLYTPEMSRRARAVELWAALKYLGKSGVDQLVYGLHERAVQFGRLLRQHNFRVLNDIVFNQVVVSCGDNDLTKHTMEAIQQSGECWVGGSTWRGQTVIRVSICSWATTSADVKRSVRAFVKARASAMEAVESH